MPSTHVVYCLHHKHFFPHLLRPNSKGQNKQRNDIVCKYSYIQIIIIFKKRKRNSIHTSIKSNLEPLASLGHKCYLYSIICKYFMTMVVPLLTIDDRYIKVLSSNIHLYCRKYISIGYYKLLHK